VDAGTLSNLPGGIKTKGLRVKGDDTPIAPAEFRDVDVATGTIKDNIMTLPNKEPSQVLYSLLGTIVDEGRRFASAADLKVSDMSSQSPVGTTLAILERTLKVMSAVQARIHYAMRQEFRLLKNIIRDYTDDEYTYEPNTAHPRAKRSDYDMVEVIPVSDPNAATMSQKVVQYQAALQLAAGAPQIYDLPLLHRQMLEVLGIRNVEKLIPSTEDQKPKDPISENMNAINGKPLKAFIYQDHDAHITAHMSFLQDPMTAQMIGQNPMANQIGAALQAHIAEHYGFKYRQMIEQKLGAPLPEPDEEMPEDYEVAISRLVAQAAQQLTTQNQAQAAQEQAQQQAQDPIIQMQMQELQLKAQEQQRKAQKDATDAQLRQAQLLIETERIASQERQSEASIMTKAVAEDEKLKLEQARAVINAAAEDQKTETELIRQLLQLRGNQRGGE
jgi:hypothetical protein